MEDKIPQIRVVVEINDLTFYNLKEHILTLHEVQQKLGGVYQVCAGITEKNIKELNSNIFLQKDAKIVPTTLLGFPVVIR